MSSSRLKAASGGRAVTRSAPALGCGSGGPKSGTQLAASHPPGERLEAAAAKPGALAALRRARELAVEEDGKPEARDLAGEPADELPSRRALGLIAARRAGKRRALRCTGARRLRRHVDPLDAGRGAADERARRSRRRRAPRVSTVRLWTASEWRSSSAAPVRTRPRSRRSRRGRGPRRSSGPRAPSSVPLSPRRAARPPRTSALAVDADVGLHHDAVEVDRHLDRAADRGRGAERDVAGAEELLVLEQRCRVRIALLVRADPELGDVGAVLAVRRRAAPSAARRRRRSPRPGGRPRSSARPARRRARSPRSCRRRPACPRRCPRSAR